MLADQEEGRLHICAGENLEHCWSSVDVGTVIKGERIAAPGGSAILDSQWLA